MTVRGLFTSYLRDLIFLKNSNHFAMTNWPSSIHKQYFLGEAQKFAAILDQIGYNFLIFPRNLSRVSKHTSQESSWAYSPRALLVPRSSISSRLRCRILERCWRA